MRFLSPVLFGVFVTLFIFECFALGQQQLIITKKEFELTPVLLISSQTREIEFHNYRRLGFLMGAARLFLYGPLNHPSDHWGGGRKMTVYYYENNHKLFEALEFNLPHMEFVQQDIMDAIEDFFGFRFDRPFLQFLEDKQRSFQERRQADRHRQQLLPQLLLLLPLVPAPESTAIGG